MSNRFYFQAWSFKQKKMFDLHNWNGSKESFYYAMFVDNRMLGEGVWHVLQSTGRKDINGKLICECDIVKCGDERLWKVQWNKDGFWELSQIGCNNEWAMASVDDNEEIEVVGNIYENEDLLK